MYKLLERKQIGSQCHTNRIDSLIEKEKKQAQLFVSDSWCSQYSVCLQCLVKAFEHFNNILRVSSGLDLEGNMRTLSSLQAS